LSVQKVVQGSLYQNGIQAQFSSVPISYINNAVLELKSSGTDIEWLVIDSGAHHYLLSTKNLLSGISYNQLNIQGFVSGNSLINIGDSQYKIRLITNKEWNDFVLNQINLNTLLIPNADDLSGNYNVTTISTSNTNTLLHWWNTPSLTKDVNGNNIIIRGGNAINTSSNILTTDNSNWRIMLEKLDLPPAISDNDRFLGNFTSSIVQEYTITDPENDLFKVEEILDGSVTRTLENQPSKTKFTYGLSGTYWSNITSGSHTIVIRVTDICDNISIRTWTFNKIVDYSTGTSTNLTRPIITTPTSSLSLVPMNALVDNIVNFNVVGGELVYANEINIVDNSNSSIVIYNKKVESFDFYNTIPLNTLINGHTYQIKMRTYNSNNQYSAWSDTVLVKCLTPPNLNITTIIDGKIQSPNPLIMATYNQNEGDELYSYIYNLYKDGALIASSEVLLDKLLEYQFSNLENKTNYLMELKVRTSSGMENSVTQDFYCVYLQTKLPAVLKTENSSTTGSVKITSYVRQIRGRIFSGDDINYIDDTWADLHNTVVIWDKDGAFRLDGDWTAKIWARDLENNDVMLVKFVLDDNNYIQLSRYNNMFSLSKIVNGIKLYELHSFVLGDILSTDQLYFFIQNDVDLGLMNFDVKRVTDGRNTWYSKSYDNDIMPSYASENGFLTFLEDDFKNILLDNNIDGDNMKVYIPTIDDLLNANTSSILGKAIVGDMILGNDKGIIDLTSTQPYFTRTIDNLDVNKIKIFNTDGTISTSYPNSQLGIRFVIKIPNNIKVSSYIDSSDGCHLLALKILNLFTIQNIGNLQVGDRIKAYAIKYKNELVKFTILSKTDSTISLLSDVINTSKEFDKEETVFINGNPNWNLSNLKQWLNSNSKIG
jgi:hypothetical protein